MRYLLLICTLLLPAPPAGAQSPLLQRGHLKLQAASSSFPAHSLLRELSDPVIHDASAVLRLNLGRDWGRWDVQAHYQLLAATGGRVELAEAFGDPALAAPVLPLESLRWLDMQQVLHRGGRSVAAQRLDRLNLGWRGERLALRLGRQAVSWGNGLFYAPMDMLNPFDPAAIDTEYKRGDDMLHAQYLLDDGSDLQLILLQRGDGVDGLATGAGAGADTGLPGGGAAASLPGSRLGGQSAALKYHHFGLAREVDLLLASHLGETVLGVGLVQPLGEAVLRGDLVLTRIEQGSSSRWVHSTVANLSTSWTRGGIAMSASLEYFRNGFGAAPDEYAALFEQDAQSPASAGTAALFDRIRRGELFTLGRHYLAASVQMELHPLLNLSPTLFANLDDRSALFQASLRWEPAPDWQLLAAFNLPLGGLGSEFGGLRLPPPAQGFTLASGPSLQAQLAFYFD